MIGCLRTRVRNQPIIALYFELENELKLYNLEARNLLKNLVADVKCDKKNVNNDPKLVSRPRKL